MNAPKVGLNLYIVPKTYGVLQIWNLPIKTGKTLSQYQIYFSKQGSGFQVVDLGGYTLIPTTLLLLLGICSQTIKSLLVSVVRSILESSNHLVESPRASGKQVWVLHSHKQYLEEGLQDCSGQNPSAATSSYLAPLTLGTRPWTSARTTPEEPNASTPVPCKGTHLPACLATASYGHSFIHVLCQCPCLAKPPYLDPQLPKGPGNAGHSFVAPFIHRKACKKGEPAHCFCHKIAFRTSLSAMRKLYFSILSSHVGLTNQQ